MDSNDPTRDKRAMSSLVAAASALCLRLAAILLIPGYVGLAVGVLLMGIGIIPAMRFAKEKWVKMGIVAMMLGYAIVAAGIVYLARTH